MLTEQVFEGKAGHDIIVNGEVDEIRKGVEGLIGLQQ